MTLVRIRTSLCGACSTCKHICQRVAQASCSIEGIPSNARECKHYIKQTRLCDCGEMLCFVEKMMPNPFKKNGPGFPGGHYRCENCGRVHRSQTSDSKYAAWVEGLMDNHKPKVYPKETQGDL